MNLTKFHKRPNFDLLLHYSTQACHSKTKFSLRMPQAIVYLSGHQGVTDSYLAIKE